MRTDLLRHPVLGRTFFPPRPAPLADPTWVRVPGAELACWRAPGTPVVLCFHSNGETVADMRRGVGAELASLGAGLFLAEQRGVGGSTGQHSFQAYLDDAQACLAATGVPPSQVVVFGRSMGSLAAIELAGRHRLRGLILESGIADLGERIRAHVSPADLGTTDEGLDRALRERFDAEQKLARHTAPILLLASGKDERVDPTHAARLLFWAKSEDRELVVFPRGAHADVFAENRPAYVAALGRFLTRVR